jgi:hypothetical protein
VNELKVLVYRSVMIRQIEQSDTVNRGGIGDPAPACGMIVDAERPKEERERNKGNIECQKWKGKKEKKEKKGGNSVDRRRRKQC